MNLTQVRSQGTNRKTTIGVWILFIIGSFSGIPSGIVTAKAKWIGVA